MTRRPSGRRPSDRPIRSIPAGRRAPLLIAAGAAPEPTPPSLGGAKRIIVTCPPEAVTGGPEALHQLVDALVGLGAPAALAYVAPGPGRPFRASVTPAETPAAYRRYRVPLWRDRLPDERDVVVVLPEIWTLAALEFAAARVGLWWLSVDNNLASGMGRYFGQPRPPRPPIHLVQSAYARAYLAAHGAVGVPLSDYLSDAHLGRPVAGGRGRRIAFNPKKGFETTVRIIRRAVELGLEAEWVPIAGLDAAGVAGLLATCRVYVDFGPHPGMDRLPREAAIAGCCVVTGRRGAAAFEADVPIPARFRVPDEDVDLAVERIAECLDDAGAGDAFEPYRAWIRGQRDRFIAEVAAVFGLGAPTPGPGVGPGSVVAEGIGLGATR